jgi:hypothetical protein
LASGAEGAYSSELYGPPQPRWELSEAEASRKRWKRETERGEASARQLNEGDLLHRVAHVNKRIGRKVDAYLEWKHSGESKHERNEGFAVVTNAIDQTSIGMGSGGVGTIEDSVANTRSYKGRTVDALASNADEGRGTLRKASGSCVRTLYPRISEWGNPAGRTPVTRS